MYDSLVSARDTGLGRKIIARRLLAVALVSAAVLSVTGCSAQQSSGAGNGSKEASTTAGHSMAGAVSDIYISNEVLAAQPEPPVLNTPEDAVRSYLDWTSYAYRIAQSQVATPVMTPYEEVRIDSYTQFNLQRDRVLDQTLTSLKLGKVTMEASRALVPAQETWSYKYVSVKKEGGVLEGPYKASYDATYTVVKKDGSKNLWVVDSVEAKPHGTVK